MRGLTLALGMGLMTLWPRAAQADECVDAYDGSQRSRRAGELLEARRQLLICAQTSCPEAVTKECTRWLREVNASLPTVVVGVRDAAGNDVTDVRVSAGGRVLAEHLDGRAIELDPGAHRLRFQLATGRSFEKAIVVREGEKNRLVQLQLEAPKTPKHAKPVEPTAAEKPGRGIPTLALVLGSVGVAALGGFAYFAVDANSDVKDLEKRCMPDCDQRDVDRAKRKALAADIFLGVGVVSLGAAGWVVLVRPEPASATMLPRGGFLGVGTRL